MSKRGFWLADLDVGLGVRLPAQVLGHEVGSQSKFGHFVSDLGLKVSPMAARARYLRTLDWLKGRVVGREAYLRLWACAYFSGYYPYALHVIHVCAQCQPETEEIAALRRVTVLRLRNSACGRCRGWQES